MSGGTWAKRMGEKKPTRATGRLSSQSRRGGAATRELHRSGGRLGGGLLRLLGGALGLLLGDGRGGGLGGRGRGAGLGEGGGADGERQDGDQDLLHGETFELGCGVGRHMERGTSN